MRMQFGNTGSGMGRMKGRLVAGLVIAAFAVFSYCSSSEYNAHTGKTQYIALSPQQEVALGLQAAPSLAQEYGGVSSNMENRLLVDKVGRTIVSRSDVARTGWNFQFHLLADENVINAFALPGGQVFITTNLFNRMKTEGQLAAVLAHEISHVVARHGAQHLAKQNLAGGLSNAAVVASGDYSAGQVAAMIGEVVNLRYGRDDELESDALGVRYMSQAGYDPRAMIKVMEMLAEAGSPEQVQFFSTHPSPMNRIERIQYAIEQEYPEGVPEKLSD